VKNPVLRIKKGARVYDDSQEQTAAPPRESEPAPRGRARRAPRRGRPSLLLPLVALVLALVVVVRVLPRGPANRAVIGGWNTTLRAAASQGTLEVSVTFVKEGPAVESTGDGPSATVKIVLPDTGQQISLSGALSKSPITLRGRMDYSARVKRVLAEVSVGGSRRTLRLSARAGGR
jgi:hypothetical protein